MVDWIKCVPIVGTGISLCETVKAVAEGNGKKALWKLGETAVGGAMDALTVVSLGSAAIATTTVKTATKVVASQALKNVAGATFVRGVGTTFTGNEADKCAGSGFGGGGRGQSSGGGGRSAGQSSSGSSAGQSGSGQSSSQGSGGDRGDQSGEKDTHEMELDDEGSPITKVITDSFGRVAYLYAEISYSHIRLGDRSDAGYSDPVRDYVRTLDMLAVDQVGHIISWLLGGPYRYRYNYIPQHRHSNRYLYNEMEKKIRDFLEANRNGRVYVRVDFYYDGSNKRPTGMDYYLSFWRDDNDFDHFYDFHWSNDDRNVLSKPEYRRYDLDWFKMFKKQFYRK